MRIIRGPRSCAQASWNRHGLTDGEPCPLGGRLDFDKTVNLTENPLMNTRESSGRRPSARKRRRHLKRKIRNFLLGVVGPPLVSLWTRTLRVRYLGVEQRVHKLPRRPTGIFVFWHQRMLAFAGVFQHTGFRVIVSQHGDGEMIARIVEGLGMQAIRGSTTRGGVHALREILRDSDRDVQIAITPDGPRGPRFAFREGAIYLASRSGLALFPVAVSFASYISLPTWDGFIIPRPFTRTVMRLGEKIVVPPDIEREEIEKLRSEAERRLRELTESTDSDFTELYRKAKHWKELVEASGEPPA
jgi:lysophospholipid acyltransferase (LPLAT)-like uncharacterized protein